MTTKNLAIKIYWKLKSKGVLKRSIQYTFRPISSIHENGFKLESRWPLNGIM